MLWDSGFRPFFLAAGVFSIFAMIVWMLVLDGRLDAYPQVLTPSLWHAHEMLFGYSYAIIAGFLLTAVNNWTGLKTTNRRFLLIIFCCWLAARVLLIIPATPLIVVAAADIAFNALITVSVSRPIIKVKQWRQMAIVGKLVLLFTFNLMFYLDALAVLELGGVGQGSRWAVYGAFYTIIALILTMSRRLIPFFTEKGVGYSIVLRQSKLIDVTSLVAMLVFLLAEVFGLWPGSAVWMAALLFLLHSVRLYFWYTRGIWGKPLLWSLFLSYGFIVSGFLLYALAAFWPIAPFLPLHVFALGGVGMVTVSMMARVALGHTGRDIHQPPNLLIYAFLLLLAATIVRVAFPLFFVPYYVLWIQLSASLWVLAFALFVFCYWPILLQSRIDGRPG